LPTILGHHFNSEKCHKLTFRVWRVQRSKPLLAALEPISR
jgi:hypothetical protein